MDLGDKLSPSFVQHAVVNPLNVTWKALTLCYRPSRDSYVMPLAPSFKKGRCIDKSGQQVLKCLSLTSLDQWPLPHSRNQEILDRRRKMVRIYCKEEEDLHAAMISPPSPALPFSSTEWKRKNFFHWRHVCVWVNSASDRQWTHGMSSVLPPNSTTRPMQSVHGSIHALLISSMGLNEWAFRVTILYLSTSCLVAHKALTKLFHFSRSAAAVLTSAHDLHPDSFPSFSTVRL